MSRNIQKKWWIGFFLAVLLAATPTRAQESSEVKEKASESQKTEKAESSERDLVTRVIEVKHADAVQLRNVFARWAQIDVSRELGVLTIIGEPERVAAVEQAIKKLDVPERETQKNVELVIQLLGATNEPEETPEASSRLGDVITELKSKFPYTGYKLLETTLLRARPEERAEIAGFLPSPYDGVDEAMTYHLQTQIYRPGEAGAGVVHLRRLTLQFRVPAPFGESAHYYEPLIKSNLDIRDGHTVVVGKAATQPPLEGIFLVITANLVD